MGFTCVLYTTTFLVGRYWDFKYKREMQHDGKKSVSTHSEIQFQIWYDDVLHERTTFSLFPNFIFTQHSKNHEAGVRDQFIFRNACLFPMSVDQLYTCTCICNLQSLGRSPYEYFYVVILTPKQTI